MEILFLNAHKELDNKEGNVQVYDSYTSNNDNDDDYLKFIT